MKFSDHKFVKRSQFDEDFLWGASVSPHQVEGYQKNQWTKWEHETAARKASTAREKLGFLPVWDDIAEEVTNPHNYVSGKGVDHLKKYALDFQLAGSLGLNAMRSGVEWSRVNPHEGVFDAEALDFYSTYFRQMSKSGLEPVLNLFHWTVPQWFEDKGGFAKYSNLHHWRDFVHSLVQNMDLSSVRYIITINEANTFASMSYGVGEFAPGETNFFKSLRVYVNLAIAHRIAYKIIKKKYPSMQVGVAHQCNKVTGVSFVGSIMAGLQAWYWNWSWLRLAKHHDFIGFNYYFSDYRNGFSLTADANPTKPTNDLGWYMEPSGIEEVLAQIARRYKGKPILITENGVADMHDEFREWWLTETISAMRRAVKRGIPLIGYLHWSLLDNFEWQYGWFPKFGLIAVDRKTMKRTVKQSAKKWSHWLLGK